MSNFDGTAPAPKCATPSNFITVRTAAERLYLSTNEVMDMTEDGTLPWAMADDIGCVLIPTTAVTALARALELA